MKRYFNYAIMCIFGGCTLGAMAQKRGRMTTEAGSLIVNFHAGSAITKISNSAYSNSVSAKSGFSGGFDAAYYFLSCKRLNIGLSLGVDYSYYRTGIQLNYSDSLWTTDADAESVHLYEKGQRLTETQKLSSIDVPVLVHFNYPISARCGIYLNTGMYLSMFINKKFSTSTVYTASGYYPKYNATFFNVDVTGSSYFYPTDKSLSSDGALDMKSNFGVQMAFGFSYSLSRAVAITAGVDARMGLKNMADKTDTTQPLVNVNQEVNSLAMKSSNTKVSALVFEMGISWKPSWLQKKKKR